jgi:hypothetical protein
MLEDTAPEENYQDEGELAARDASLLSQDEIHHEVSHRGAVANEHIFIAPVEISNLGH